MSCLTNPEPSARRVVSFRVKMLRSIRYLRLCIALVLGVMTSVGVAWGLYKIKPSHEFEWRTYSSDGNTAVQFVVERTLGTRTLVQSEMPCVAVGEDAVKVWGLGSGFEREERRVKKKPRELVAFFSVSNHLSVDSAGFPMLCVQKREDVDFVGCFRSTLRETGRLRFSKDDWDGVPSLPLWDGLTVNTAFYGAAWYPVLAAPGLLLARLRRRKGKCGACGYDMQGLVVAKCPECGKI